MAAPPRSAIRVAARSDHEAAGPDAQDKQPADAPPGVLERVITDLSVPKFYFFGLVSTVAASAFFQPLNLIKTKQQAAAMTPGAERSMIGILRRIVRQDGVRGLYRGLGTVLLGTLATDMLYCTSFELALLETSRGAVRTSEEGSHAVSGLMAEFASNGVVVPFEVVSQRLMVQSGEAQGRQARSGYDVARRLIAQGGVRELYRGYFITAATFGFESLVWWGAYAFFRRRLYEAVYGSASAARGRDLPMVHFGAGFGAGVVTAVAANPLDVFKTRTQLADSKIEARGSLGRFAGVVRDTLRTEGWRVLVRGTGSKMIYLGLLGAVGSAVYELIKTLAMQRDGVDSAAPSSGADPAVSVSELAH